MSWFTFGRKPVRRLTAHEVRMIRGAAASGQTQASLAERFDVSPSTIHDVVTRRTWRNV